MRIFVLFFSFFAVMTQSFAGLMDRQIQGQSLIDIFANQGVPRKALLRTFQYVDQHENHQYATGEGDETVSYQNKKYMIIIDMGKPSSERRLYFMNLLTGEIQAYFVAHGIKSGGNYATDFSNIEDSNQTSLGIYLTGQMYQGDYGTALNLYGLEASNSRAFERRIVMHGASYVSMDFLDQHGRMGRSFGCPAVSHPIAEKLLPLLEGGAILSIHHDLLMDNILDGGEQVLPPMPNDEIAPLKQELFPPEVLSAEA